MVRALICLGAGIVALFVAMVVIIAKSYPPDCSEGDE